MKRFEQTGFRGATFLLHCAAAAFIFGSTTISAAPAQRLAPVPTGFGLEGDLMGASIAVLGDGTHAAFDNLMFLNQTTLIVGEDRGDKLHGQLNALDSIWAFDLFHGTDARILAEGRDAAATVDAHLLDASSPGFQNEGDNETTGLHFSNGDSTVAGLHGTANPGDAARFFFTQQHGNNTVFEIVGRRR